MSQLIRLVYASRAAFRAEGPSQGLDPAVARILARSRKNNARQGIVGGLLFGDGHFLQCLEGEIGAVTTLYNRIEADPRHRDVTMLSQSTIGRLSFGAWSMKYVPGDRALRALLAGWGQARFDPYGFSRDQLEAAVRLMQTEADAAATLPAGSDAPPAGRSAPRRAAAPAPAKADRTGAAFWWVIGGVTLLSLAAIGAAFMR